MRKDAEQSEEAQTTAFAERWKLRQEFEQLKEQLAGALVAQKTISGEDGALDHRSSRRSQ
jgi:hypothetical protein